MEYYFVSACFSFPLSVALLAMRSHFRVVLFDVLGNDSRRAVGRKGEWLHILFSDYTHSYHIDEKIKLSLA